jgi:hypothetical protein
MKQAVTVSVWLLLPATGGSAAVAGDSRIAEKI